MNPFEMVVMIIAIVVIGGIIRNRQPRRGQRWERDHDASADAEKIQLREEVRELKERVAVLERIATDNSSTLAHEIEMLRDK